MEPFSFSWYKLGNLVCIARRLARLKNAAPKTMSDFNYLDDNPEMFQISQDYRLVFSNRTSHGSVILSDVFAPGGPSKSVQGSNGSNSRPIFGLKRFNSLNPEEMAPPTASGSCKVNPSHPDPLEIMASPNQSGTELGL